MNGLRCVAGLSASTVRAEQMSHSNMNTPYLRPAVWAEYYLVELYSAGYLSPCWFSSC